MGETDDYIVKDAHEEAHLFIANARRGYAPRYTKRFVAQKSTFNYFQIFATGQQQPSGGITTCQAVDPGGDISLWEDVFQLNGALAFSVITGTGNWVALAGAKFQG